MNLFAYGTLMIPRIWRIVSGRADEGVPARLRGYRVRRVEGDLYPVMLRGGDDSEDVATGLVYFDLAPETWETLDQYESPFYERVAVEVDAQHQGVVRCQAYVLPPTRSELASDDSWDLAWFQREAQQEYLRRLE